MPTSLFCFQEIEEAEEKEIEAAGWADAMATTQVIAFIIIAMVAVVVIYVLYIARKKVRFKLMNTIVEALETDCLKHYQ